MREDFLVSKSYCTQTDVERAMGVAAAETNVTQTMILSSIESASDEVDLLTHTRYLSIEDSGTATTGGTTTLTDSTKSASWTTNCWANYVCWIYGGTGSGQYARIASNTTTVLTFHTDDELATTTDNTSTYRIVPDIILSEDYDGNDLDSLYLPKFPIRLLLSLSVTGTSVTASKVYVYGDKGQIVLHSKLSPEAGLFTAEYPQCISVKWAYGIYPVPNNVARLTAAIAGIQCLITQIGGTYNDVTTYSLPGGFSASKGEPYTNVRETLSRLEKEVNRLIPLIIKRPVVVV